MNKWWTVNLATICWVLLVLISIDQGRGGRWLIVVVVVGLWWLRLALVELIWIVLGAYLGVWMAHMMSWASGVALFSLVVWWWWVVTVLTWLVTHRGEKIQHRLPLTTSLVDMAEQGRERIGAQIRLWVSRWVRNRGWSHDVQQRIGRAWLGLGLIYLIWWLIDIYSTWLTRELVPTLLMPWLIVWLVLRWKKYFIS
jgi:hypothetical protein